MTAAPAVDERHVVPLVERVLVVLVIGAQVIVVGGLTFAGVERLSGAGAGRLDPLAVGVASLAVALTAQPVYRWARAGAAAVASEARTLGVLPFAGVADDASGEPVELLSRLAATCREVLDAGGVRIDVRPDRPQPSCSGPWAAGASASNGSFDAPSIDVPLADGGRCYGQLCVSPRRWVRRSGSWDAMLAELARHVGLVVSSAVLREELAASRQRIVLAREEERRRIRRDLHDGLGPDLAAIKLMAGAAQRQLAQSDTDLRALDELRDVVADAMDGVRRVVEDLRPPLLDDCGLLDALRSLRFVPPSLRLRVDAPAPLPPLPAAVEVALYRIGAEAVRNVVRHAGASTCVVTVAVEAGRARLTVRDDGGGLRDPRSVGVGTASMVERGEELGGTVLIGNEPGGGTCVTADIPVPDWADR